MNLARIRKAIVAGVGATIAAIVPVLISGAPSTGEGWGALIGGALGLGITTGIAAYGVRNAGTINGSDPVVDLGDIASYRSGSGGD